MKWNNKPYRQLRNSKTVGLCITEILILLLMQITANAQEKYTFDTLLLNKVVDLFDLIRKWTKKPPKINIDTLQEKVKNLSLLPIVRPMVLY